MTSFRRELRSFFLSPVALIFLLGFLVVTLVAFFTVNRFFARNLADLRPLFGAMPLLMLFLTSAITMRLWSEEQRAGTLEVLLTLPVRVSDLVFGKFLAGLSLVGIALALTFPLAITVAALGDVDPGPVIGGYLGTLLLAAMYLAIGCWVSSITDNQLVSLLLSVLACGVFYVIGADAVTGFLGSGTAVEVMRSLGAGSRFESIERGVIDLRDLLYYLSITGVFLTFNVAVLQAKGRDWRASRHMAGLGALSVLLIFANVVLLNVWMAPVGITRIDLTEDNEYSVSSATRELIAELDAPVTISGYFSEKTHPLLSPLLPKVRDMLHEYEIAGRGKVKAVFADPTKDEELEKQIYEGYGIETFPFQLSGRHEESLVNSYFHILVQYGDVHHVLSIDDLIDVKVNQTGDSVKIDVKLAHLEYDLTRAIQKVSKDFQTIDAMLADLPEPAKLTAYVTPDLLPDEYKEIPTFIRNVAGKLEASGSGKFVFAEVDPAGNPELQQSLYDEHNIRPLAVGLFRPERFYLHMLLEVGGQSLPVFPEGTVTEREIQDSIEAGIKRAAPGFLKTVGIATVQPADPSANLPPQYRQFAPPPAPNYNTLQQTIKDDYEVKQVDLTTGIVPADIDLLVVGIGEDPDDKSLFAIDQFLMKGGAVVMLSGAYHVTGGRGGVTATQLGGSLRSMLATYGVTVEDGLIADTQHLPFPLPVKEQVQGLTLTRMKLLPYVFFADIRADGFAKGHPTLQSVRNVVPTWASAIRAESTDDVKAEVLLQTSETSWVRKGIAITPDFTSFPDNGFEIPADVSRHPVAVSLVGKFKSHYADKPSPLFGGTVEEPKDGATADRTGRTVKQSLPDARIIVIGSPTMVADLVQQGVASRMREAVYAGNMQFLHNVIDWSLEDTALLEIRSAGAYARTLRPMTDGEKLFWEIGNYILVLLALVAVIVFGATGRYRIKQIRLRPVEATS